MEIEKAKEYLARFEAEVLSSGFEKNIFGKRKEEIVPLRFSSVKHSKSLLRDFLGTVFDSDNLFAINYYGLYKLSSKIIEVADKAIPIFGNVRSIKAPVIHLTKIRLEHIKKLSPELLSDFMEFKKFIVDLRWGSK